MYHRKLFKVNPSWSHPRKKFLIKLYIIMCNKCMISFSICPLPENIFVNIFIINPTKYPKSRSIIIYVLLMCCNVLMQRYVYYHVKLSFIIFRQFYYKKNLQSHIDNYHNPGQFQCKEEGCGKIFIQKVRKLIRMMNSILVKRVFVGYIITLFLFLNRLV